MGVAQDEFFSPRRVGTRDSVSAIFAYTPPLFFATSQILPVGGCICLILFFFSVQPRLNGEGSATLQRRRYNNRRAM